MATLLKDYHLSLTHIVFLGVRKDCQKSISLYLLHAAHFTIRFRTIGGNNFYRFMPCLRSFVKTSSRGEATIVASCRVPSLVLYAYVYFI